MKGADVALSPLLDSQWHSAECKKLAADGLRTLVMAKKTLTEQEYEAFEVGISFIIILFSKSRFLWYR